MTTFVALLRAINVGGTGKLAMKNLVRLCTDLGFEGVRTYIQSGNVVLRSALAEDAIKERLEQALAETMAKPVDVVVRTAPELQSVLEDNPFPNAEPSKVGIYFQSEAADEGLLERIRAPTGEDVRLGRREIYIHFPNGMGRSKLKLPAGTGTMRNVNTVTRLVKMAQA